MTSAVTARQLRLPSVLLVTSACFGCTRSRPPPEEVRIVLIVLGSLFVLAFLGGVLSAMISKWRERHARQMVERMKMAGKDESPFGDEDAGLAPAPDGWAGCSPTLFVLLAGIAAAILVVHFTRAKVEAAAGCFLVFAIVVTLFRAMARVRAGAADVNALSSSRDPDIRRLGGYNWYTRDSQERYEGRRDAADVLSKSTNHQARHAAVACLMRKPNLAVLDTCSNELFAGLSDSDSRTAYGCLVLIETCLRHAMAVRRGRYVSGVGLSPERAVEYIERLEAQTSNAKLPDPMREKLRALRAEVENHVQTDTASDAQYGVKPDGR